MEAYLEKLNNEEEKEPAIDCVSVAAIRPQKRFRFADEEGLTAEEVRKGRLKYDRLKKLDIREGERTHAEIEQRRKRERKQNERYAHKTEKLIRRYTEFSSSSESD